MCPRPCHSTGAETDKGRFSLSLQHEPPVSILALHLFGQYLASGNTAQQCTGAQPWNFATYELSDSIPILRSKEQSQSP